MDGSTFPPPRFDVSTIAGRITAILARRHDAATRAGDEAAKRYDVGLETIYFASLLLMIDDANGQIRSRADVLAGLDTASAVIAELRPWIEEHVA